MTDFAFDSPWYLLLLLLVPVLWIFSFRSLAGMGTARRLLALGLRTVVFVLLVMALAEAQYLRTSEKISVIYLLDQSESIPAEQRRAMLDYVIKEVGVHRDAGRGDKAGLIVFGREAAIEVPPFDDDIQLAGKLETVIDLRRDATNLSAAMKLAQATFPEDSAKRVVIVTDGNENIGDARAIARMLVRDAIGIDVVPVSVGARAEVAVEKVTLPEQVRKDQPFVANIVVNNMTQPTTDNPTGEVKGTLRLIRRAGGQEETLEESQQILKPGKSVFQARDEIKFSQFYTYEARFEPDDAASDTMSQNNRATAFTHVRGKGHILIIEDFNHRGEFSDLELLLRKKNEVTVKQSNAAFSTLAELQSYDCIILANVPRSSPDEVDGVTRLNRFFSEDQIDMLVRNTQQMGGGLVMLGGDRSFGAGDWAETELEKAMPVEFTIKNAKIRGVGALVMIMHACELPQGNHWEKVVAKQAIQGLGSMDYCGLLAWNDFKGSDDWLWQDNTGNGLVRVGGGRQNMINRTGRMSPGDMPQFDPAMKKALAAFNKCTNATTKHMIIISDGDPSRPSGATMRGFQNAPPFVGGKPKGIQISTVAIGTHGPPGSTPLQNIATSTGGKYYVVNNPRALPRIYQREVRRVARPLIHEKPIAPQVVYRHEMLRGIDDAALPVIDGFVLTQVKENPLVEVSALTDQPAGEKTGTILASWTYGLGRSVAFTTDGGARWASSLKQWPHYERFFTQMIDWAMRPTTEEGKFNVVSDVKDGKVQVVVTALDADDEFLNFLEMGASVVGPDNKPLDVPIRQVSPGRYIGEFEADNSGSFLVNINGALPQPGEKEGEVKMVPFQLRSGVSVPYSDEYRNRETNLGLLDMLAGLEPNDGKPGKMIQGAMERGNVDQLVEVDTFRHDLKKAVSSNDIWPLLLLALGCLFLADVFVRRVQFSWDWLAPVTAVLGRFVLRPQQETQPDERLQRLRSRKHEATAGHDQRRAAARFEPQSEAQVDVAVLDESSAAAEEARRRAARPSGSGTAMGPAQPEEETYTERLMKAKKEALKRQQKRSE